MNETIISYMLSWNRSRQQGAIRIQTLESGEKAPLAFNNPAEFQAIAAILQNEAPVYFNETEQLVFCGSEPVID